MIVIKIYAYDEVNNTKENFAEIMRQHKNCVNTINDHVLIY